MNRREVLIAWLALPMAGMVTTAEKNAILPEYGSQWLNDRPCRLMGRTVTVTREPQIVLCKIKNSAGEWVDSEVEMLVPVWTISELHELPDVYEVES